MRYIIFLLSFSSLIIFPAGVVYADPVRLERLHILFEGVNSASAYVRHCVKKSPKASENFHLNSELIIGALAHEALTEHPQLDAEDVLKKMSDVSAVNAKALDKFYRANGCRSPQALAAKEVYEEFNARDTENMVAFLDTIEDQP